MFTTYSLCVRDVKSEKEFEQLTETLKKADLFNYVFVYGRLEKDTACFESYEQQLWHSHYGDMVIISEMHPNMIFQLTCYREDGAVWQEYYHDGMTECCTGEVIFEQPHKVKWDCLVEF